MLRSSYTLATFIAALTTLMGVLVLGQSHPASTNPVMPHTVSESLVDAAMPICYIQLENGQLRDLRRLCGKKSNSPASLRSVQRPAVQPAELDPDDDESAPRAIAQPQPAFSPPPTIGTPSPPQPPTSNVLPGSAPLPATNPLPASPDRPASVQPSPANPSTIVPSVPQRITIPQDRD